MPYKPTGKPPGRPRKPVAEAYAQAAAQAMEEEMPTIAAGIPTEPKPKPLSRAREGFRRAFADPTAALHHPPRFGSRKREVGKRPILHPNVIGKA